MSSGRLTYAEILGRNISGARGRLRLSQAAVAARMKALGFEWHQQTAGAIETGRRRLAVEEIVGLSEALETSIRALMAPVEDDKLLQLPSGATVTVEHLLQSVLNGKNDRSVQWDGNVPVFLEPLSTATQLAAAGFASHAIDARTGWQPREIDSVTGEDIRPAGEQ